MKLTQHKSANSGSSKITFPKLESWNPMSEVATIAADVEKRRVLCRISKDILTLMSPDHKFGPMNILADNRDAIQDMARKLIEEKAFEEDGSILIRKKDI